MIDMNCSVYSKADNLRDCPMANYHSWAEILGMDILIDEDVEITPLELTAGLLWEITYYGEQKKCRMRTKNGYSISKNSENLRRKEKYFFNASIWHITGNNFALSI